MNKMVRKVRTRKMRALMKKILFVDDDSLVLKAYQWLFANKNYTILTAESGTLALDVLEAEGDVDLVVADLKMPGMDGFDLLNKTRTYYPRVFRILVSDYTDEARIFEALRKGVARQYFRKPWENEKLVAAIDQLFATEELLQDETLLTMVNSLEDIPTIRKNYQNILNLIEEEADLSRIAREVEKDPSIAGKVLHIANSAFYGAKTGSVTKAMGFIGLENTRSLVMSTSVFESLGSGDARLEEGISRIWDHAFVASRLLPHLYTNFLKEKLPELFLPAGLLHRIGVAFLLKAHGRQYLDLLAEADQSATSILILEKKAYGMTHLKAGAYLLRWWDFPYPVVETALFYNRPLDPGVFNQQLVAAVHVAGHYAYGILNYPTYEPFEEGVFDLLKVSRKKYEESLRYFQD